MSDVCTGLCLFQPVECVCESVIYRLHCPGFHILYTDSSPPNSQNGNTMEEWMDGWFFTDI